MIVYKGFNEKLQATCGKGTFQYEVGKTYKKKNGVNDGEIYKNGYLQGTVISL